jgi:hypothetical protein
MQNKANFQKVKLNVTKVLTKDYDQMDTWSIRITKPIKANKSQLKPKQTQFQSQYMLSRYLHKHRLHRLICLISKALRTAFEPSRPRLAGSG